MRLQDAFRRYKDEMIRAMTLFCHDGQAVRDGVSHAFTQALTRTPEDRRALEEMPEPALKAWLYAAARNAIMDAKRHERLLSPIPLEDFDAGSVFGQYQIDHTDRLTVEALLDKLPPALSRLVRMKYFERMNATEIGTALGLPPATVRTRLRTAILMMRDITCGVIVAPWKGKGAKDEYRRDKETIKNQLWHGGDAQGSGGPAGQV
jgi:RNA polymerase sigma factor (sigma-70 family)